MDYFTVLGIIASGTIIRGTPDPASDLDLYVIHQKPFRQRIQKYFNQVPAEIFINPPKAVENYFVDEQKNRRPLTAHMLSSGFVVLKLDPIIDELQAKAQEQLKNPPARPTDLTSPRYLAALLVEDAVDKIDQDPETAVMILNKSLDAMFNFYFVKTGNFIPRQKSLLDELEQRNPTIAKRARQFFQATIPEEKMNIALKIADETIGVHGFFEWDSGPEEYK